MTNLLIKHKNMVKDKKILMITISDITTVSVFIKRYQLYSLPNITVLRDPKLECSKLFGTTVVPSFFVYENNQLIKKMEGETKIENLVNKWGIGYKK